MGGNDIAIVLLRTFLSVAVEGSFFAASRMLGCSQATASLRVKKLEERLQARVFKRGGSRAVQLTATGRELLPDAEAMVALHDRIVGRYRAKAGRFW